MTPGRKGKGMARYCGAIAALLLTWARVAALPLSQQRCHQSVHESPQERSLQWPLQRSQERIEALAAGQCISREKCISSISSIASGAAAAVAVASPKAASAAPPLTAETADNLSARAERALRPKPPKVFRPRLNLDFAVLLMRSSYNAVDAIDIVPMDQFQRDFFLIRQAEYLSYCESLGPGVVTQGDLADPNYFDFISFAQYKTISRELLDPPLLFQEQQPVEEAQDGAQRFATVLVRRDPSFTATDLVRKHTQIVGDSILDKLDDIFASTALAIPAIHPGSRPAANALLASLGQLANLFVVSGFALNGSASIVEYGKSTSDAAGSTFSIVFTSPATLWSGQALKNGPVLNDFALKASKALVSRAGYNVVNESVKYGKNQEISTFSIV